MNSNAPFVSVIIPTYHDWGRLKKCLAALEVQTFPQDGFEVIVVNNDPQDPIPEMELPPNFQIISESKPGSYAARNNGISVARGEILAFTDSDCIPYEDWIEKAVERLLGGAERIAGHVELFFSSEELTFAEIFEKAFAFRQLDYATEGKSATANMITWRRHFQTVGMFNDLLMSGGDSEWGLRATALNIPIVYADDVVVKHPARSEMKTLRSKRKRIAGGRATTSKTLKKRKPFWLVRGFLPPLIAVLRIRKRKELTLYEKAVALGVLYYLKIYSTIQGIKVLMGFEEPERS